MTEERFTPQMYLDYYTAQRDITVEDIGVAPAVVISWGGNVIQALAERVGAEPASHWFDERYPCFTGQVGGQRVSFVEAPVGAPGTVLLMEEMIACGARLFLGLGWAGSLQPSAPVGTMFLPSRGIREEGTSYHYLVSDETVWPDEGLLDSLWSAARAEGAEVVAGPQWTTDAPFREFKSQIAAYQEQGVLGVGMETSAMYALGQFREVRVCNLLVVSDELWDEWRPAFGSEALKEATDLAQRVVLRCLETGFEST